MLENGKINRFQLFLLLTNFLIGSALIFTPSRVIGIAKQDAWMSILLLIILGSIFVILITTLSKLHFGKTIVGINKEVLGNKIGLVISLLYVWLFIHLSSILLCELTDLIEIIVLEQTPRVFVSIFIGIMVFYAIYYGLEVITRSNEIFSFLAFIGFILTVLLLTPLMELDRLQPIIGDGCKPIVRGTFPVMGFTFGEMAIFLMIIPFVNNKKHLTKILIGSGVVAGLTILVVVLSCILVLGVSSAESSIYAPVQLARLINIGDFLSRVEVIFNFTYFITVFIKLCLTFYAGVLAFAEVLKLSFYRPIIIPMLIIAISLAQILFNNIIDLYNYVYTAWEPYIFIFSFGIPSILLILTLIKRRKKRPS